MGGDCRRSSLSPLIDGPGIAGTRSRSGLTLTGTEHIAKSYPHFFHEIQRLGVTVYFL